MRTLAPEILKGIRRGIEKESLRVRPDGTLSTQPHPRALGAALTHPHITTDFSESQLELITGAHAGLDACLEELTEIHKVVYRSIGGNAGDELMWADEAEFQAATSVLTLTGLPLLHRGKSILTGDKFVINTDSDHEHFSAIDVQVERAP